MKLHKNTPVDFLFPVYSGLIVSFVLSVLVLLNIINYGSDYDTKIILTVVFMFAVWLGLFLFVLLKRTQRTTITTANWIIFTVLFAILAVRMVIMIWGGYEFGVDIYDTIANDVRFYDTLYHSEIANALRSHGTPVTHINEHMPFGYHAGSHFILMLVSRLTGINQLFVYCYLYRAMMLPIFVALFSVTAMMLRSVFSGPNGAAFSYIDAFVVFLLVVGLPGEWIGAAAGGGTSSRIGSESQLFGYLTMFSFICIAIAFYKRNWIQTRFFSVLCFVICPVFVFITTHMKVSTGLVLCACIVYFFLRTDIKCLRYRLAVMLLSVAGLLLAFIGFIPSIGALANNSSAWEPFAFVRGRTEMKFAVVYYLFFCGYSLLFLFLRWRKETRIKNLLRFDIYAFEQMIFLVCVCGQLPGLFMRIGGGSTLFFAIMQGDLAVLMLLAYDYPNKALKWIKKQYRESLGIVGKTMVMLVAFAVCFLLVFNFSFKAALSLVARPQRTESYASYSDSSLSELLGSGGIAKLTNWYFSRSEHLDNPLIAALIETDRITRKSPQDYSIFIDETSTLWDTVSPIHVIRYFTGYTGVLLMNAIYQDNDRLYYRNGVECGDEMHFYPIGGGVVPESILHQEKMTLDEVLDKARLSDKKTVLWFSEDAMQVINLT